MLNDSAVVFSLRKRDYNAWKEVFQGLFYLLVGGTKRVRRRHLKGKKVPTNHLEGGTFLQIHPFHPCFLPFPILEGAKFHTRFSTSFLYTQNLRYIWV